MQNAQLKLGKFGHCYVSLLCGPVSVGSAPLPQSRLNANDAGAIIRNARTVKGLRRAVIVYFQKARTDVSGGFII